MGSRGRFLSHILNEWRGFVPSWLLLLGLNFLSIPIALLIPYPLKMAVDRGVAVIVWACAFEFALIILKSLLESGVWAYQFRVSERVIAKERARLFQHLQKLSIQFLDRRGTSDLFYHLQNDVSCMMSLVTHGAVPFLTTATLYVSMVIVSLRMDVTLTLLALGALPFTWLITSRHLPKSRRRWEQVRGGDQEALGVLQEVLGASRLVRAFGQEARETERFEAKARAKLGFLNQAMRNEILFGILIALIVATASAATLYVGIVHVRDGKLSLGALFMILAYLAQLLRPLETLTKHLSGIQSALVSAEKVFALQDVEPAPVGAGGAVRLTRTRGEIEFRSVSFRYDDGRSVLEKFSLKVEPGMKIGIAGPTGSGKTTLLGLLLRFFDPNAGQILLDGMDLRTLDLADLRRQFAVVPQEPIVFMGTIGEAIAYGKPDASRAEIEQAARQAEAHGFISRLPMGYDTHLEDRGANLSGGERQRIAIARAFLLDAPILLMDEPSNHLDEKHEFALAQTLLRLQEGKTIFTVSHSPEFLKGYDLILQVGGERPLDLAQLQRESPQVITL